MQNYKKKISISISEHVSEQSEDLSQWLQILCIFSTEFCRGFSCIAELGCLLSCLSLMYSEKILREWRGCAAWRWDSMAGIVQMASAGCRLTSRRPSPVSTSSSKQDSRAAVSSSHLVNPAKGPVEQKQTNLYRVSSKVMDFNSLNYLTIVVMKSCVYHIDQWLTVVPLHHSSNCGSKYTP